LLGDALMAAVLAALQEDKPLVSSTAGLLSQPATAGTAPDLDSLITQAQPFLQVRTAAGVRPQPFGRCGFACKGLQLGEALEWGAWLAGCGVRQENNEAWLVDDPAACYGPPALQVVSLAQLAQQQRALGPDLPQVFMRLLPELYPTFFRDTQFRCVGLRLAFIGDRRQLALAQRLRATLEAGGPANAGEAQTWKPKWRVDMERNLAEPFQDPPRLSGAFSNVLPVVSAKLRCSLMVDPAAMRDKATLEIHDLDTTGLVVGQALERLAHAAGLKPVLEGNVLWLRAER
jgi:hypothetical protein